MKLNPTIVLTFLLLSMMLIAGGTSARWGLTLGTQALKEVTQPDIRPTTANAGDSNSSKIEEGKGIKLLEEKKIVEQVKAIREGKVPPPAEAKPQPKAQAESQGTTANADSEAKEEKKDDRFPMASADGDVNLEVGGVKKQNGSLELEVTLKNSGSRSVQFLYSFLNVTDDRGRSLSATTEGLPGELPPNDRAYSGTVTIPTALLENAQKLSLTLTDYPDRQLQLELSDIPIN
ncbi:hypothetical protein [Phormidium sp. CCY1219]|uniref:hypothetical protein n=1 Tax=Phormidium sp. CCY1219 TaxID=2886104 RepID=UPI002D1E9618|nr:hypothetical protein [Phormidium sp. CCY1219]MEB3827804.1 hypothetical protein [Phormidium sp. CCY1219]